MSTTSMTSVSEGFKSYSASQPDQARREQQVSENTSRRPVTGKTIGDPKLSKEGASYYEELKRKYAGMDFILVSTEEKERAKAQAASYATPGRMVVLIDEEKIERMATDETYRKQYEAIIAGASRNLSAIGQQASATGAKVKTYGMQVNDNGTASFFAVLEKSNEAQRQRIEKKAEQKKADRKEEQKKAQKEAQQERLQNTKEVSDVQKKTQQDDETVTIWAGSVEELLQKIQDMQMAARSDMVQTEEEKNLGQHIDFAL